MPQRRTTRKSRDEEGRIQESSKPVEKDKRDQAAKTSKTNQKTLESSPNFEEFSDSGSISDQSSFAPRRGAKEMSEEKLSKENVDIKNPLLAEP